MLIQLQHHNVKTDEHVFVAQRDWGVGEATGCNPEFFNWVQEVKERHPLPTNEEGIVDGRWLWLACNEQSPYFFWSLAEQLKKEPLRSEVKVLIEEQERGEQGLAAEDIDATTC